MVAKVQPFSRRKVILDEKDQQNYGSLVNSGDNQRRKRMAKKKDRARRLMLAPIGEYYEDILLYDCFITGRQQGMQAASLLCAKLQEREGRIEGRLEYLAKKRGISVNDLKQQIREGDADPADFVNDDGAESSDDIDDFNE